MMLRLESLLTTWPWITRIPGDSCLAKLDTCQGFERASPTEHLLVTLSPLTPLWWAVFRISFHLAVLLRVYTLPLRPDSCPAVLPPAQLTEPWALPAPPLWDGPWILLQGDHTHLPSVSCTSGHLICSYHPTLVPLAGDPKGIEEQ